MKKFFKLFLLTIAVGLIYLSPAMAQELPQLSGTAHIQDVGWVDVAGDGSHLLLGTEGQARRIEALSINTNMPGLGLSYQTHVQDIGWQGLVHTGERTGTEGQAKQIECFVINLEGEKANQYTLYYRTHVQNYGWLDWAQSGQHAGTSQHFFRCEALELIIVPAGTPAPSSTRTPAVEACSRDEGRHMYLVNTFRKQHGLNYVTGDINLRRVAEFRVNELPIKYSHTRPNGLNYVTAVKDVFPNYRFNGGGFTENLTFGRSYMCQPDRSFNVYMMYPHSMDAMLDPSSNFMAWAGTTYRHSQGTMGYSIELFSSLDRIDFAD